MVKAIPARIVVLWVEYHVIWKCEAEGRVGLQMGGQRRRLGRETREGGALAA